MRRIKTIVFAGVAPFLGNSVFDRNFMSLFHGGEVSTDLAFAAQKAGFEFLPASVLRERRLSEPALLLSDIGVGCSTSKSRLIPSVCICLESPIVANRFHHYIRSIGGRFHHTYCWGGVKERLAGTSTHFHAITWPSREWRVRSESPWGERRLLTMVSGNKRAFQSIIPKPTFRNSKQFLRASLSAFILGGYARSIPG